MRITAFAIFATSTSCCCVDVQAFTPSHKIAMRPETKSNNNNNIISYPNKKQKTTTKMSESKCPFSFSKANRATTVNDPFFPDRLNLKMLSQSNVNNPDPSMGHTEYAALFNSLDLDEVKKDITNVLTTSQDFWPADYGNYAPFFIRQAWHQAGTYRLSDGRGGTNSGNQRFTPLNSWPDNANLDKARRLLWPIKQKYGKALSWADLMMLVGNQSLEIMGLKPFGFAGGRLDIYTPEEDVYWGPEGGMLTDERHESVGEIHQPLGASEMGLIYVNPEGPGGDPSPLEAAKEIRATFGNMAMNDEETVALIAGGHTFGKSHGACPVDHQGPPPESAPIEMQGLGYKSDFGTGVGKDATTSGLEGAWTSNPTDWDNGYFENLFQYDWQLIKGPGGKSQWEPTDPNSKTVPDAHQKGVFHKPMMFTTDLALKEDPIYGPISKRFYENPDEFAKAFAKAWYKLTHRDMGPIVRLLGPEVPAPQIWQDPLPTGEALSFIDRSDIQTLKSKIFGLNSKGGLKERLFGSSAPTISALVKVAWASASTFRQTDYRGGANGARIRLAPQRDWAVNDPKELEAVLSHLEGIQKEFNSASTSGLKSISMADLIVLAGSVAVEEAAKQAGVTLEVPFLPGRTDALDEHTDNTSFDCMKPKADGFRNFYEEGQVNHMRPEEALLDRAHLLGLTAPEMTVLVGGLRVLGANAENSELGCLTEQKGVLTNDFFLNLLDMETKWKAVEGNRFEGTTGDKKWKATRVDLAFGHNSELRAIAEYYACSDSREIFIRDFVKAWTKVMQADRFDIPEDARRSAIV